MCVCVGLRLRRTFFVSTIGRFAHYVRVQVNMLIGGVGKKGPALHYMDYMASTQPVHPPPPSPLHLLLLSVPCGEFLMIILSTWLLAALSCSALFLIHRTHTCSRGCLVLGDGLLVLLSCSSVFIRGCTALITRWMLVWTTFHIRYSIP